MTREEFVSIPQTEKRIRTLKRSIIALRSLATSLSAPLGGERVQASGHSDRTGRLVAEIADTEALLMQQIMRLTELRLEATRIVNSLPDPEQTIVYLRYICGLTWDRVAEESGYDARYVYKIGKKAINSLFPRE